MSTMPYEVKEIGHPYKYNMNITTIAGPGVIPQAIAEVLNMSLEKPPSAEQLAALCEMLNTVFLMGRRAVQSELRAVIGLRWNGHDFELRCDS